MYIYHALINALGAHMIHINLNMIFYTHVKHSPTKTTHTKQDTERQPNIHKHHNEFKCVRHWSVSYMGLETGNDLEDEQLRRASALSLFSFSLFSSSQV